MSVTSFNFTTTDSGYVMLQAIAYSIATGAANCKVGKTVTFPASDYRATFRFNTSSLGSGAIVSMVEFRRIDASTQSVPVPNNSAFRIGSWCGAALSADSTDYNATGAFDCTLDIINDYTDGDYINLNDYWGDDAVCGYVNLTGVTDCQVRSLHSLKEANNFNFNYKTNCQLRVTYTVPATLRLRTLTGVGLEFLGLVWVGWRLMFKMRQSFNPLEV